MSWQSVSPDPSRHLTHLIASRSLYPQTLQSPPPTLFYKYEAFLLSRPSGLRAKLSILTLDTIRELRKEIQREQQINALNGINGTPGGPGSADETTPKGGMGVRKGKGNMTDLGGLYVDRLGCSQAVR